MPLRPLYEYDNKIMIGMVIDQSICRLLSLISADMSSGLVTIKINNGHTVVRMEYLTVCNIFGSNSLKDNYFFEPIRKTLSEIGSLE